MGSVSVLMALAPSLLAARTSRPRSLLAIVYRSIDEKLISCSTPADMRKNTDV